MVLANGLSLLALLAVTSVSVAGPADVTPELRQKAQTMCSADAMRLCPDAISDETEVVACMKTQREQLTPPCRQVYDQVAKVVRQQSSAR